MGDEHSIEAFQQRLEQHLVLYLNNSGRHYEDVKQCTKIIYDPNGLIAQNNRFNVDYILAGETDAELQELRFFFAIC